MRLASGATTLQPAFNISCACIGELGENSLPRSMFRHDTGAVLRSSPAQSFFLLQASSKRSFVAVLGIDGNLQRDARLQLIPMSAPAAPAAVIMAAAPPGLQICIITLRGEVWIHAGDASCPHQAIGGNDCRVERFADASGLQLLLVARGACKQKLGFIHRLGHTA